MNPNDNLENSIRKLRYPADDLTVNRIRSAVLHVLDEMNHKPADENHPPESKWRSVMKTKLFRYAAAAVLMFAVIAAFATMLHQTGTPAYAVEQTIEAMRNITSLHAYTVDWDGSEGVVWVQVNPETGYEEYYRAEQGNYLIVGTPQATYYYDKDKNTVRIRNEYVPASDIRVSRFMEDLVPWVQQYNGQIAFDSQFDDDLRQDVILVHVSIPSNEKFEEKEFVVKVNSQTKLPISMEGIKCGQGEGVKIVNQIEFNIPIPEGVFEFTVPEGAKVVYGGADPENIGK